MKQKDLDKNFLPKGNAPAAFSAKGLLEGLVKILLSLCLISALAAPTAFASGQSRITNYEKTSKDGAFHAAYPSISGMNEPQQQHYLNTLFCEHAKKSVSVYEHQKQKGQGSLAYTVTKDSDNLMSIVFTDTMEQSAQDKNIKYAYTFDSNNGKLLKIRDLFFAGANFENTLKQKVEENIGEKRDGIVLNKLSQWENFYLTDQTLNILFNSENSSYEAAVPLQDIEVFFIEQYRSNK